MNSDYLSICSDLSDLGLKKGDIVLIHSSFKSLGYVHGGIESLINAILAVIGDSGTLIAPTLTYRDVSVDHPVFDYINTPSCVGAVSEYVRLHPDSKRSIHPTHSCSVIGAKRDYFAAGHEIDRTPIGQNSPFFKLKEHGGKILMLGCGLGPNTSCHGIEEAAGASYVLPKTPSAYTIILPDRTYTIDFYRHHITQNGFSQHYERAESFFDDNFVSVGAVHGAKSFLIGASELWKRGIEKLKEDECFFVEKVKQ